MDAWYAATVVDRAVGVITLPAYDIGRSVPGRVVGETKLWLEHGHDFLVVARGLVIFAGAPQLRVVVDAMLLLVLR